MKKYLLSTIIFLMAFLAAKAQNITGPTTVNVGETQTYTFYDGVFYMSMNWMSGAGTIITKWNSGNTYYATVQWNAPGATTLVALDQNFTQRGSLNVTVNVPVPNTTFTLVQNCNSTNVTRNTNPLTGINWYWQTSATGTVTTLGLNATITRTTAGALYLRARWGTTGAWSSTSQSVGNITLSAPLAAPATSTDGNVISSTAAAVPVSVSTVTGATAYWWYTQSTGGTPISGPTTTSYSPTISTTTPYYVASVNGNCPSTTRKLVTANVHPVPVSS